MCFYEPFNEALEGITPAYALSQGFRSWNSRHPRADPYWVEYLPLIRKSGGIRLFDRRMPFTWFIPIGGLQGELRLHEKRYLALLVRYAQRHDRIPVLGLNGSLGRLGAIKNALGGLNIFQYRNLWKQWISYLSYKRQGESAYYRTVARIISVGGDEYTKYLAGYYANPSERKECSTADLESLSEHDSFAIFMGLHIYLYLHSQLAADLTVDATRMARDARYRSDIERELRRHTGLSISLSDATDGQTFTGADVDAKAINWDEIREHVSVAVRMLSHLCDHEQLTATAAKFVDETLFEMRRPQEAGTTSAKVNGGAPSSKRSTVAADSGLTASSAAPGESATPSNRLFTSHGTVLYVDPAGELRHGPADSSPINASLVSDGAYGQIICEAAGARQPIVCLLDRCQTLESANRRDGPFTPTILEVVPLKPGAVGLKAGGVFLCAEADGRVTLSRPVCSDWERFYIDEASVSRPKAETAGSAAAGLARPTLANLDVVSFIVASSPRAGGTASVRPFTHLFTAHGTVLYVDPASGELRHQTPNGGAANAGLLSDGAHGQIVCEIAGFIQPIVCLTDSCRTVASAKSDGGAPTPTIFEIVRLDEEVVALKSAGVFLCAEGDGRVTLSRTMCSDWEEFHLGEGAERRP
jgi:hypothetical protein